MNIETVLQALQHTFPALALEAQPAPVTEHFIRLPAEAIRPVVEQLLNRLGVTHLSAITAQDTGEALELLYHFWEGTGLTLRIVLPYEHPTIATVTDLIPGALFYEREAAEMVGITFEGHPDPKPLLLPDDWDEGAPLRSDFTLPSDGDKGANND